MDSRLRTVADGVWCFEGRVAIGLGIVFPARTTLLALPDGGLIMVSPLAIDDALAASIESLGEVRFIVAPNLFHHLFAGPAAERWPNAQLLGVSGFKKKRPDLAFDGTLRAGEDPAEWAGAVEAHHVGGTSIHEVALLHVASKTLVVTDLVFNLSRYETWMSSLYFRMTGVHNKVNQSPLLRVATKDRAAAGASCDAILACDFDRLIMAHGDIVETGGKEALRGGLTWMLKGRASLPAAGG